MATSTSSFPVPVTTASAQPLAAGAHRRRRISPQAGHALEILGHAIEYLTDEFVHEGGSFTADNPKLQAVQMLMTVNRQVYFECPEIPPLSTRIKSLLHLN